MEKFMLLFHSPIQDEKAYWEMAPEAIQGEIQKWNTWLGGLAAQGKMHGAEALMPFGKVMKNGGGVVTDGPYTEGKEIVGGYTIVTAATIEEAIELAKGCPGLDTGGTVEVRQVQKFD